MEVTTPQKKSWLRKHYHWVIFVTVFLEYMLWTAMYNNRYSLFLLPVTNDLGISRSAFALCSTLTCIPGSCSNLLFPKLYKKFGFRKLAGAVMIIDALIYIGYTKANGIGLFYVGALSLGVMISFVSTAAVSRLITDWFHLHRGLLLGIILAASGIGGSLGSMILTAVIEAYNWRVAYGVAAGFVFAGALLIFLLIRSTPQEMGLLPLGDEAEAQQAGADAQEDHAKVWEGIPLSILKKRFHFYLMVIVVLLSNLAAYVIYPTVVAHVQDLGMSLSEAAQIQSFMFLFLAAAKIVEGALSDRFGAKKIMIMCIVCCAISAFMLAKVPSYGMAVLGMIVFSFALAESTIMLPVLVEKAYGFYDRNAILGVFLAVTQLAVGFGPTLANLSHDALGSYTPIYYVMSGLAIVCLGLFFISARGAEKERERIELEESRILNP